MYGQTSERVLQRAADSTMDAIEKYPSLASRLLTPEEQP